MALLAMLWLMVSGCGNGKSALPAPQSGPLSGNWQINLYQDYPRPPAPFGISGFLTQATDNLTGSLQVPALGPSSQCGGVSSTTGTISGQNVTIAINNFGSIINLTGTISSDNTSMSGDYQALGGACFTATTTGTWNALLIPPLNGSFKGVLSSNYLETIKGASAPVPVTVSGTMSQSDNDGASNATLTGTINAVNYPCFDTATFSGSISGQNVFLILFGYNGEEIGTLGDPPPGATTAAIPAIVSVTSSGTSVFGNGNLNVGFLTSLGESGPCPAFTTGNVPTVADLSASLTLNF
jgi:hypothetical protein